jgi:hypothetical protein
MISAVLPDLDALDIEALKALVIANHSELLEQYKSNAQQIEHLKLVIEKYRRMIFGRKSEKLTGQLEQLEFRLEELETATSRRGNCAGSNGNCATAFHLSNKQGPPSPFAQTSPGTSSPRSSHPSARA